MCHNLVPKYLCFDSFYDRFLKNFGLNQSLCNSMKRKKLSEDLNRLLIAGHRSGNGYDQISKHFGIQYSSSSRNNAIFKAAKSVANPK